MILRHLPKIGVKIVASGQISYAKYKIVNREVFKVLSILCCVNTPIY